MHSELEASLQAAEERLWATSSELEKQKILNEKLEMDLLAVEKHKPNGDALSRSNSASDPLAGLDIGKGSGVSTNPNP